MTFRRISFLNPSQKPLGVVRKEPAFPLAKKSFALEFSGGCTVLSIQASNSVLSEKALNAFKYAFLCNKKIGIGSLPSNVSPTTTELDKATAAYEIARMLVDWSEQLDVDDNLATPEINTEEGEHRSCDVKKEFDLKDGGLPFNVDAKKDLFNSSLPGEVKDLDFDLPPKCLDILESKPFLDVISSTRVDSFLDSLMAPTSCESMDFFGSPFLDEMNWNGKFDRFDITVGGTDDGASSLPDIDMASLLHGNDTPEDNLSSPVTSPGSPCSPCSPSGILR